MNFISEVCKKINSTIFYKPNSIVESVNSKECDKSSKSSKSSTKSSKLSENYEKNVYIIKKLYRDKFYKNKLLTIFTSRVSSKLMEKHIVNYINNNYNKSDIEIFKNLQKIINEELCDELLNINYFKNHIDYNKLLEFDSHDTLNKIQSMSIGLNTDYCHNMDARLSINYKINTENNSYINHTIFNNMKICIRENKCSKIKILYLFDILSIVDLNYIDDFLNNMKMIMDNNSIVIIKEYNLNPLIKENTDLLNIALYYDMLINAPNNFVSENISTLIERNYNTEEYWNERLANHGFIKQELEFIDKQKNEMEFIDFAFSAYKYNKIQLDA